MKKKKIQGKDVASLALQKKKPEKKKKEKTASRARKAARDLLSPREL